MLEQLAHAETGRLPRDLAFIEITIPDSIQRETLSLSSMAGWNTEDIARSRAYGDHWLTEQRTCILLVPSVIVPIENNVLINPSHADFARVVASVPRNVNWDKRLKVFPHDRGASARSLGRGECDSPLVGHVNLDTTNRYAPSRRIRIMPPSGYLSGDAM
jgi:hypothetical protein